MADIPTENAHTSAVPPITIIEHLPDAVWTSDEAGRLVDVRNAERVLGLSADDLRSGGLQFWETRVHPDDWPTVATRYRSAWAGQAGYDVDFRLLKEDGTWIWMSSRATGTYEVNGQRYLTGVASNITARKAAVERQIALADYGLRALESDDIDQVLAEGCNLLTELVQFDTVGVLRYDPEKDAFIGHEGAPYWPGKTLITPSRPERVGGVLRRTGEPFVYEDVSREERIDTTILAALDLKSGIIALLGSRERPYGMVSAHSHSVRRYSVDDVALVRMVGNVMAAAAARYEVEKKLRAARELYESVARSAREGIVAVNPDGVLTFVNMRMAEMLGRAPEDLIGRDLTDLVVDEDRPTMLRRREARLRGEWSKYDVRFTTAHGGFIWASVAANPITDRNNVVLGAMGVISDVTERVEAARLLQQQRAQLEEAQAIARVGSWEADLQTGAVTWSDEMYRIVGLEPHSRHVDLDFAASLFPPSEAGVMAAMTEAFATNEEIDAVHRITTADGEDRWVRSRARPALDTVTNRRKFIGTMQDITDEKKAQAAQLEMSRLIVEAAAEWRITFDSIEAPIVILDTNQRVRRLNTAAMQRTRFTVHRDAVEKRVNELGPDPLWREIVTLHEECLAAGRALSRRLSTSDGKHWDVVVNPWNDADRSLTTICATDVTAIVQLQQSLQRSASMSAVGSLVAGVAHEVRNPLFGISATLDAVEAIGAVTDAAQFTGALRQQVSRLNELMHDLLEYGRPSAGSFEVADLRSLLLVACDNVAALAASAGVEIVASVPADLGQSRMDRRRLLQVFENLLQNAVQHSTRGSGVELAGESRGGFVTVTVADRGPGFRPEDLPRLFEPFFTRRRGGTGLGLSLAQRIVEEHDGTIAAASREGGGAIISVRLPLAGDPR